MCNWVLFKTKIRDANLGFWKSILFTCVIFELKPSFSCWIICNPRISIRIVILVAINKRLMSSLLKIFNFGRNIHLLKTLLAINRNLCAKLANPKIQISMKVPMYLGHNEVCEEQFCSGEKSLWRSEINPQTFHVLFVSWLQNYNCAIGTKVPNVKIILISTFPRTIVFFFSK